MQRRLIAALLLLAITAQTHAALSDSVNTMFSNVTGASQYTTADRVGFQGGGVAIRSPISPINIVAFDPPRIGAGCGGLNFYGGSFSLINKDQFVALLRKIAQNSLGLAFKMAIDVVNPTLGKIIGDISSIIQNMNQALGNTCAIAQAAMAGLKKAGTALMDTQQPEVSETDASSGTADDTMSSMFKGAVSGLSAVASAVATVSKASDTGNPIWNMIVAQQSGDQLFSTGVNIGMNSTVNNEILMSMTGFVIYNSSSFVQQKLEPSTQKGSDGTTPLPTENTALGRFHERLLTTNDLRNGWSGSSTKYIGKDVKAVYICNPDFNPDDKTPDCTAYQLSTDTVQGSLINQQSNTDIPFLGMTGFVNQALFGNPEGTMPAVGAASNAIDSMITGVKLTQAQSGVMLTTRLPVASLIYFASSGLKDRNAAFEQAKVLAPIIADEYTYAYVNAAVALMHQFLNSIATKKVTPPELALAMEYWEKERNDLAIIERGLAKRIVEADTFAHAAKAYNPAIGFTVKSNK